MRIKAIYRGPKGREAYKPGRQYELDFTTVKRRKAFSIDTEEVIRVAADSFTETPKEYRSLTLFLKEWEVKL